jgi:solute carrier family 1 (high affinity glutamate transporter) protein 1
VIFAASDTVLKTAMKINKHTILTVGILAGLVLGVVVGEALYRGYDGEVPVGVLGGLSFVGNTFFIGLLKMVLVPLVVSSVVVGVSSIGDPAQLGRIGGWTVLYYFGTMVVAVVIGVVLVTAVQPGKGFDEAFRTQQTEQFEAADTDQQRRAQDAQTQGLWGAFQNIAKQLIPSNPIGDAAAGRLLPVISFSLIMGIALTMVGERARPVLSFFDGLYAAVMRLVDAILWLAPLGVFCLVAWTVARIGTSSLVGPLGTYMLTVVAGLAVHALLVLPLVLWVFGRTNPYRFMHQMREALLTAFGTDSSSATLPVTIDIAENRGGVSKRAAGFVLPLGATVNMDGTALYEAVAVVFLFQCFGIELGTTQLVIIVITATLSAVGAAGIPSAGLVTMVIVVQAVNNSLAGGGGPQLPMAAVGIILGVDRILDMCRTTVNVWGDSVGAKIISRIAPDPQIAENI